ncbi:hypothetical protein Tco_0893573 [Tanacetum coccineum]|uniref:Uncharacterized protein n=1 Tax=Tanacetum coccineum TaxID=301880 RepID=A0ABQ5C9B3_9ASTR
MAMISAFTTVDKTAHNSRKFAFTLSPTYYGYWKTMTAKLADHILVTGKLRSGINDAMDVEDSIDEIRSGNKEKNDVGKEIGDSDSGIGNEELSRGLENGVFGNEDLGDCSGMFGNTEKNANHECTEDNVIDNKQCYIPTVTTDENREVVIFDKELVTLGSQKWCRTLCGSFVGYRMSLNELSLIAADQGLVLHQMTSDHNRSELGIQDHSNEPSSSKLVPKVVPLAVKTATSRQELELLFHLRKSNDARDNRWQYAPASEY